MNGVLLAKKKPSTTTVNPRLLQRKCTNGQGPVPMPPIVHEVLSSPGRPLDPASRAYFEPRFGHEFSRVRVHADAQAAESAREVNALAYAAGHEIVFGTGKYAPHTANGRRLLAHELTHAVQQDHSARNLLAQPLLVNEANDPLEHEADRVAEGFGEKRAQGTSNQIVSIRLATTKTSIACKKDDTPIFELGYAEPRAIYLIKESVHSVISLPLPSVLGLYSSLVKVLRVVIQLHTVWMPEKGKISTWDTIKDWLGIEKIKKKYTGEHRWILAYVGSRNFIDIAGKRKEILPSLSHGSDPVPSVQLYGNPKVKFEAAGGEAAPAATMLYDGVANKLMPPFEGVNDILQLPGAQTMPGPAIEEKKSKKER